MVPEHAARKIKEAKVGPEPAVGGSGDEQAYWRQAGEAMGGNLRMPSQVIWMSLVSFKTFAGPHTA